MSFKSVFKELLIFIALAAIVIFVLMILLYDFVPTEVPAQTIEYTADSTVKATLEEVSTYGGNSEAENTTSLLKSYTVDSSDLKFYETKKSYDSGKANPFIDLEEEVYDPQLENTISGTISGNPTKKPSSGSTSTSSSSGGSTSTSSTPGTFFEGSTK